MTDAILDVVHEFVPLIVCIGLSMGLGFLIERRKK